MLNKFRKNVSSPLDDEIDAVLQEMSKLNKDSEEYTNLLASYERLNKVRTGNGPTRVSPDTVAIVIGNLVGVVFVLGFEQTHVVTSKALSMVVRPK